MPWPEADETTLRALWSKGLSGTQISHAMDKRYTRNGIIGKVHRMKLEARNPKSNRHLGARKAAPEAPPPYVPPVMVDEPKPIGPPGDFPAKGFCRAIPGDTGDEFICCGHPVVDDTSYCLFHRHRFMVKTIKIQRRGAK